MYISKMKFLFALCGSLFVSWATVHALTVIPMDLQDLTTDAEFIFSGSVSEMRSEKEGDDIYTYVSFSDLQVVKGMYLEETMTVRLMGGTVEGETLGIPGMPEFVVGEKNLLFVVGNFQSICPIVGWGQGRFKIERDPLSGQEIVLDDTDVPITGINGHELIWGKKAGVQQGSPGIPDGGDLIQEAESQETRVTVDEFVAAIRQLMGIE